MVREPIEDAGVAAASTVFVVAGAWMGSAKRKKGLRA
jgi:hypothetical protein